MNTVAALIVLMVAIAPITAHPTPTTETTVEQTQCNWTYQECIANPRSDPNWSVNCYQGPLSFGSCRWLCRKFNFSVDKKCYQYCPGE